MDETFCFFENETFDSNEFVRWEGTRIHVTTPVAGHTIDGFPVTYKRTEDGEHEEKWILDDVVIDVPAVGIPGEE